MRVWCSAVTAKGPADLAAANPMTETARDRIAPGWAIAGSLAVGIGLIALRVAYGYELFHALVELFSVAVAVGVFGVAWNGRRFVENDFFVFIGIGFLVVSGIDLIHTLTFKGMGVLPGIDEYDVPTQLWVQARLLQGGTLVLAPLYLTRRLNAAATFAGFGLLATAGVLSVLVWDVFPTALVAGEGLTTFKIAAEYVVIVLLGISMALIFRQRARFAPRVFVTLNWAIGMTIASELSFTLYVDPFAALNLVGHLFKVAAFFLFYQAVVVAAFQDPYGVLFRELTKRESELAESEEALRLAFEQASSGIAHVDLDDRIIRANQRLAAITGYSLGELLELRLADLRHPASDDVDECSVGFETPSTETTSPQEECYVRKDGSTLWVSVTYAVVRSPDGTASHRVVIVDDVSERRAAQTRERHAKQLSDALNEIDNAMNSTLDATVTLERVVVLAADALGCESAAALMREGDVWVPRYVHRFPQDLSDRVFVDSEVPHAVLAAELGAPVVVSDALDDPRVNRKVMLSFGIRSVLTVPLGSHGRVIGTLYFNYHTHTHTFDAEEIDFASRLATTAAFALENARLYEGQRRVADTLQAALLAVPKPPPGVEIAHAYYSATELARIGGDFYDAIQASRDSLTLVVGDVSGKGLAAASLTQMVRSTIRAFALTDPDPASVLTRTNTVMAKQLQDGGFVTALVATIDLASGGLLLAAAGHPQPHLCSDGGCGTCMVDRNVPLGVLSEATYSSHEHLLSPGDVLILYTDGLIEARRGTELFGEARVAEALFTMLHSEPTEIATRLLDEARSFAAEESPDDIAVVAVRYLGRSDGGGAAQPQP